MHDIDYCSVVWIVPDEEEEKAKKEAEMQARTMPLSVVRLRFQAYLQDAKGVYSHVLPPVISNPIYDSSESFANSSSIIIYIVISSFYNGETVQ